MNSWFPVASFTHVLVASQRRRRNAQSSLMRSNFLSHTLASPATLCTWYVDCFVHNRQKKASYGLLGKNKKKIEIDCGKGGTIKKNWNACSSYDSPPASVEACQCDFVLHEHSCTHLGQLLSHSMRAKGMFWHWAWRTNAQLVCQRSFLITLILSTTVCFKG